MVGILCPVMMNLPNPLGKGFTAVNHFPVVLC